MIELKRETTKGKYSYRFSLSVGFSGAERSEMFYVDESNWDDLSEEARQELLNERLQDWVSKLITSAWD